MIRRSALFPWIRRLAAAVAAVLCSAWAPSIAADGTTATVQLRQGWHLLSIPVDIGEERISNVLGSINVDGAYDE